MGEPTDDGRLEAARAAFTDGKWAQARQLYEALGDGGAELTPEDLERHGYAVLFEDTSMRDPLGRAAEAYEAAGRAGDAARVSFDVARMAAARGNMPIAMGWTRRAHRLLEDAPEGAGHAHGLVMQAFFAHMGGKLEQALELAEQAHALARKHADVDAESLALNRRGRLLVRLGRIEEGKADLDEAMALVYSGTMRNLAASLVYCSTIDACADMADYERALQWTEAAQDWIERRDMCGLPGLCRVHRAELLRLRGDLEGSQAEARRALDVFERGNLRSNIGQAQEEIGLGLLAAGDLDAAEEAFASAQEQGMSATLGLAVLRLRQGDAAGARTLLDHTLTEHAEDTLGRARLLPHLVEACLELDDVAAARAASEELDGAADLFGTVGLQAAASTARARLYLHEGRTSEALIAARAAVREWNVVGMRTELDRARELLARAHERCGHSLRAQAHRDTTPRRRTLASAETILAAADGATQHAGDVHLAPLTHRAGLCEGAVIDGKLEIGRRLGAGAMGLVFAARHRVTGRDVAVKVLQKSLCDDRQHCARFLREALACGRIKHDNVVDVYDAGEVAGEPYIVMELLSGRTLGDRLLQPTAPSPDEALDIAVQMARGVAAAHEAGVIHRDLKPDNVFLVGDGQRPAKVKVLDFGISKLNEEWQTRAGGLVGTPLYMAPEQVRDGSTVGEAADIHAIGAVLFEMLSGRTPYAGQSVSGLLLAIAEGQPASLSTLRPDLPPPIVDVVGRALQRSPEDRWDSAAAFADALTAARGEAS